MANYPKINVAGLGNVGAMLSRPDHAFWVLAQQFAVRGLLALKFLLAARWLGPSQIGVVGIALLSVAIVESLSDTGLKHAVVQRNNRIDEHQAGAVWTLQMARGLLLAAVLLALASPVSSIFDAPQSAGLIALAAVLPLLRNGINPGVFMVQRGRNFRQLSIYEATGAVLDLGATFLAIHLGYGAASILIGNIASDVFKVLASWAWLKVPVRPTFEWQRIRELTSFGKWVWGSSVITLILNQLDKVLVAKFLGTTEFGLYQVASRVAQLIVADGTIALGQYLFPTFAKHFRSARQTVDEYLKWVLKWLVPAIAAVAALLAIMADTIINLALGPEWQDAAPILRVMALCMFFGGIMAVLVAYFRAIGLPQIVTHAAGVQLLFLLLAAPGLIWWLGAVGMAVASAFALAAAAAILVIKLKNSPR